MIEMQLRDYMLANGSADCFLEVQDEMPETYITIQKTGSSTDDDGIYSVNITVQAFAQSMYEASVLNEEVKLLMNGLKNTGIASACRLNSDYYLPDTRTKDYCYQSVWVITTYE